MPKKKKKIDEHVQSYQLNLHTWLISILQFRDFRFIEKKKKKIIFVTLPRIFHCLSQNENERIPGIFKII